MDVEVLKLIECEQTGDKEGAAAAHNNIVNFLLWCKNVFENDFYLECQPACSKEQVAVNKRFISIAKCFNLKMIVTTDAHYLKKEDRYIHKAYLNSKQAEREVDSFYEYCYLQTNEEIKEHLSQSEYSEEFVEEMFKNSLEIYDKIEEYSLLHSQQIPKVEVSNYNKKDINSIDKEIREYKELTRMYNSDNKIERYWINQCVNKLKEKNIYKKEYLDELEEEAEVKTIIGQKLDTNMFQYPILLQHYIDLIWECGSPIGVGRGSACSALNHYLLGITQLDPVQWKFPFFRYMNRERTELGDIDIDVASSKRPIFIKKVKQERKENILKNYDSLTRNNLGCTYIATFGTERN